MGTGNNDTNIEINHTNIHRILSKIFQLDDMFYEIKESDPCWTKKVY